MIKRKKLQITSWLDIKNFSDVIEILLFMLEVG